MACAFHSHSAPPVGILHSINNKVDELLRRQDVQDRALAELIQAPPCYTPPDNGQRYAVFSKRDSFTFGRAKAVGSLPEVSEVVWQRLIAGDEVFLQFAEHVDPELLPKA